MTRLTNCYRGEEFGGVCRKHGKGKQKNASLAVGGKALG